MGGLTRIHVQNYRALADVDLEVGPINVVFGPNGAGKSTLLDSLYFFRDRGDNEARPLDQLLHYVRLYHSRSFRLHILKRAGSESGPQTRLRDLGDNAWSVLRNLQDKRNVDERYVTIMRHMTEAFPGFRDIVLQQTGPSSVYASFLEKGRRSEIFASGASDGVLQLLLLLIALFSEGNRESVLLFDEPEVSLHPWAMVVFARAVKLAAEQWNKQVFVATHSPVLISQFEPQDVLVAGVEDGRARFDRLSEISEIEDLLEDYAAGSLYMSEAIAAQGPGVLEDSDR